MVIKVAMPGKFQFRMVPAFQTVLFQKENEIHYIGGSEVLPPPLLPDEEASAIERLGKTGSEEAKSLLIEHNLRLVVYIAKKFDNTVRLLQKLGLSHLSLNQKVNSLSGGENQRIKLSQALGEGRIKVFGLDEPSKGLGHKEILELISVIYENIKEKGKTFVVSEHNSEFLKLCSHVNELKMLDGKVYIENK